METAPDRTGPASLWQSRPLSDQLLPLLAVGLAVLAGVGLALLVAIWISGEAWPFVAPVLLAAPAGVLVIRYPFVGILLWMLLRPYIDAVPEAGGPQVYWLIHRALLPAAVGAVLLSRWSGLRKMRPARLGLPELAMLAFLVLTVLNVTLWSWEPARAFRQVCDRLFIPFCAYLLVRLAAPEERDLKRLLVVAFFTLGAQSLVALLSWYAPDLLPAQWADGAVKFQRTVGTLRLPAAYTGTLVFIALLLYHYALNCRSTATRALMVLAAGFAAFLVFFSFSRGSWLGGLTVLLGLLLVYPGPTLRLVLVGMLLLVVAVLGLGLMADELAWGYERLMGEMGQFTAEGRLVSFRALIEMTGAKPLLGWGYGNHELYGPEYLRPVGDMRVPRHGINSHNTFLTITTELGVPALLLYLFPAGWWLVQSLRVRRRLPGVGFWSWRLVALLWLAVLHILIASNFTDMVRWDSFGTALWWLTLGLIASVVAPHRVAGDPRCADWRLKVPWRSPEGAAHKP